MKRFISFWLCSLGLHCWHYSCGDDDLTCDKRYCCRPDCQLHQTYQFNFLTRTGFWEDDEDGAIDNSN